MHMRESLLKALRGEKPDRVVWTADITYWMAGQKQKGRYDPRWDTEQGYLELHRELGLMPYYYYPKFSAARAVYDRTVICSSQSAGNTTIRRIATPAGELVQEESWQPESCCSACTRHMVESEADLDVLLYLLEHRRLEPRNLDDYAARVALWAGYDGLPSIGLPRSPLSALFCEWAGVMNTVFLLSDVPDKMEEVFTRMEAQEEPILDALCRAAPPLVHFPDNLTSDSFTSLYDRHVAGRHRRRLEALHAADVTCAVHLDGTVRGLLPKLAAVGFDAVEALTPTPCGDADAAEMRALAGNPATVLWGGVPGAMFAPPYTWDRMERHVREVMSVWQNEPFVLGVADQVPPDGDIEFCRRIAELAAG